MFIKPAFNDLVNKFYKKSETPAHRITKIVLVIIGLGVMARSIQLSRFARSVTPALVGGSILLATFLACKILDTLDYRWAKKQFPQRELLGQRKSYRFNGELNEEQTRAVATILLHETHITKIELSNNSLSLNSRKLLFHTFSNLLYMTSLNFSNNQLGDEEVKELLDSIKSHPFLQSIDLQGNNITNEGANALALQFKVRNPLEAMFISPIEHISLKNNKIEAPEELQIAKVLPQIPTLRTLDLSGNTLDENAVNSLQETARKINSQRNLSKKMFTKAIQKLRETDTDDLPPPQLTIIT